MLLPCLLMISVLFFMLLLTDLDFNYEWIIMLGWSIVGVVAGGVFCRGDELRSIGREVVSRLSGVGRPREVGPEVGRHVCGLVFSLVLAAIACLTTDDRVVGPTAAFSPICKSIALTGLVCALVFELYGCLLACLSFQTRQKRLGMRDQQLLDADDYPVSSAIYHSGAMFLCYAALTFFYGLMFLGNGLCYHQDPVLNRPIATMRYIEWSVTVPLLMWITGTSLAGPKQKQVTFVPIIQTVSYIWLAWAGQVVEQHWLRSLLISGCFTIFFEAAMGQMRWMEPKTKPYESAL